MVHISNSFAPKWFCTYNEWRIYLHQIVLCCIMPVSYTHLDVYKRQTVSFLPDSSMTASLHPVRKAGSKPRLHQALPRIIHLGPRIARFPQLQSPPPWKPPYRGQHYPGQFIFSVFSFEYFHNSVMLADPPNWTRSPPITGNTIIYPHDPRSPWPRPTRHSFAKLSEGKGSVGV